MRRKPDIKYSKTEADFQRLPQIQREILESAAPTLKKSGIMVYSTCTILAEENQQVVAAFLADHPEFEQMPLAVGPLAAEAVQEDMLTIYPQDFMTDGFLSVVTQKVTR